MTIDDRLSHAGQRFRDIHTEPADVHLAPGTRTERRPGRAPRPRGRFVGIAVAVGAVVALTVGVAAWVTSSTGAPDRTAATAGVSPSPTATDLARGFWQLTAADGGTGDITVPPAPRFPLTLQFDITAGRYTVSDGCNDIGGSVVVDGSALRFDQRTMTTVACADDVELRTAMAAVFAGGSAVWAVHGDTLTLAHDGTTLTYARGAVTLTSGTWVLVAVDTGSPPVLTPASRYTLVVADGDSGGRDLLLDDDCNTSTLPVDIGTGTIAVTGPAASTAVGCTRPDDAAIDAASRVFGADTLTWSISGATLTVSGDGTTLTFSPA